MSRALRCTAPTGSGVHTNAHLAVQASLNGEDEAAVPALSIPLRDRLLNRSLNGFAAIGVIVTAMHKLTAFVKPTLMLASKFSRSPEVGWEVSGR